MHRSGQSCQSSWLTPAASGVPESRRCRVSASQASSPMDRDGGRPHMPRTIRAALLQAEWTGDKESMIEKHEKYAREAAEQGAKVMCFQELFYGPYFCQVQDPQYFS